MTRNLPAWLLALAASLLFHAVLLIGVAWTLPQGRDVPESLPIEARLIAPPPPPSRPAAAPAKPRPRPQPAPVPEPPLDTAAPDVAAAPEQADLPDLQVAAAPEAIPASEPAPASLPAAETEAAAPPLNALPPRIDMRFEVRYGIARGEQTLVWINEGEDYTVTSVAAATGLAGVFYSGRFVQTSRGRVTPQGLVPEEFWDQRGDKRSSARFDSANGLVSFSPVRGAARHFPYQAGAQDTLSLFFQLALTAPPPDGRLNYQVFNGKRVRDYAYDVRGETGLETALGSLRTLHLARAMDGDGRFEVWLAIDRLYLPVQVLRVDDKGNEVELRVLSIAP